MARLSFGCEEHGLDVEGFAFAPGFKSRRGEDVVQDHRQFHAVFGREEGIHGEGAEVGEGRGLRLQNKFGEVEVVARAPVKFKNIGEQNMFTRADGVKVVQADQAK